MDFNINPIHTVQVNGTQVSYGRIPSGIVEGFNEIVFYFQTNWIQDAEKHESIIRPLLEKVHSESHNHGVYWELTKVEALVWTEATQLTLASFRIRDGY